MRGFLRLSCVLFLAVCGVPTQVMAVVTPAPTKVATVATYDASRNITVSWTDASGGTAAYAIERSTDGTTFAPAGNVAAGGSSFLDTTAKDLAKTYTYRVVAQSPGSDASAPVVKATPIVVTWPMGNGSHNLMQGFGDGSPNSSLKFHEGIDIFGTGATNIVATRGGEIVRIDDTTSEAGLVIVKVAVGGGNFEFDSYLHAQGHGTLAVGDKISEGILLANTLAPFGPGASTTSDHFHFSITRQDYQTLDAAAFEKTWLNPLARFTKDADRDPLQQSPNLYDSNNDQKTLIITPAGKTIPQAAGYMDITASPVKGGVSMIADVQDNMNAAFRHSATVLAAGYYIKANFDNGVDKHDVRTAASPYMLAQFDDNWFNDAPFSGNKFQEIYADSGSKVAGDFQSGLRIKNADNGTVFPFVNNFAITNTKGADGRVANVDATQFWKSNAKSDASLDDAATANGKTFVDAPNNAGARFKDGDYSVHVIGKDLIHPATDLIAGKVRVDNFPQKAQAGVGGQAAAPCACGPLAPLYDTGDTTEFLTKFVPESVSVFRSFNLADEIGISGSEFYPDLLMPAYIFDHRTKWQENDSFLQQLASINVLSDSAGTVPLTSFALTGMDLSLAPGGLYDMIIDYDRDGMFSATLDGLGGFQMVPEPSVFLLVLLGVIGLSGPARRRREWDRNECRGVAKSISNGSLENSAC